MKPFLTDRPRIPNKSLVLSPSTDGLTKAVGAAAKRECGAVAAPQVETIKQGDKVVRVIVTCACGERIEIDCLYPAGG